MAHSHAINLDPNEKRELGDLGKKLFIRWGVIGLIAIVASWLLAASEDAATKRFFYSYLVTYSFLLSISLGALFFVMIQHIARAGWSVTVRRVAELLAANVNTMVVLFIPIAYGLLFEDIYHWTHAEGDPLVEGKAAYLNVGFFLFRFFIYFTIWGGLSTYFLNRSLRQDRDGNPEWTLEMQKASTIGIILFGLSITYAAFDLLMSLDPHWFSTIFGVYYFGGSMMMFFATIILVLQYLQRRGLLTECVNTEHYHDLGKFGFAFIVFWTYIAFSQFLLIWYGNIPEETIWYARRQVGGEFIGPWTIVTLILLFGHFFIPFLGMMSRHVKRNSWSLQFFCIWLIAMHWLDMFWLVMPELGEYHSANPAEARIPFGLVEIAGVIGLVGLYIAGLARVASGRKLVPENDPRISEALAFHNM